MKRTGVVLPDEVADALRAEARRRGIRSLSAYLALIVLGATRAERDAALPRGTQRAVQLDAMAENDKRRASLAREWLRR